MDAHHPVGGPFGGITYCGRRHALGGMAAAMLLPGAALARQPRGPHRIDLHYHFIPPAWIGDKRVLAAMSPQILGISRNWTPARAIEEMDANGIATVVGSIPNPGIWFGDRDHARRLARICNEYGAGLKQDHPGRFGFFAALPMLDADASLAEIGHAFDVLGAEGVGLFTNYDDHWLADPMFAPVFAELNRRKAAIYVHPFPAGCCRATMAGLPPSYIEYPVDTTRAILQWITTRSAARYPDLKLIFSHAGGYIMGGLGRLQFLSDTRPDFGLPASFRDEVAKFYYEISSSADRVTMAALGAYVPPTHIVLGTDSPYVEDMGANLAQLMSLGLSPAVLRAIERDNALRIIPSLARR